MQQQGQYPTSPHDADEFHRLYQQDIIFTKRFPLLPADTPVPASVLDVACGTGEWLRRMVKTYPSTECIGIDRSRLLLDHAHMLARSDNVEIKYMVRDMFDLLSTFKRKRFDLVQMRCASWFLGPRKQEVLAACKELLLLGGTFRLIDYKTESSTNSAALTHFGDLFTQSLKMRDPSWRGIDDIPEMFKAIGLEHLQLADYAFDLSYGAKDRDVFLEDILSSQETVGKLIIASGLATEEEFAAMREQGITDTQQPDFTGSWQFLEVVGQKPA